MSGPDRPEAGGGSRPGSASPSGQDWDPGAYGEFRDLRLRPARDLLAQVSALPPGDIVDLGCGAGAGASLLRRAWPDRRIVGVDLSPAMLDRARESGLYDDLIAADLARWQPARAPALLFSNAALQWLSGHDRLFPALAQQLPVGGVLAVQMPSQFAAPSHRLARETAIALFPDRFDAAQMSDPLASPAQYFDWLAPFGAVDLWGTTYLQHQPPQAEGHPVRAFTRPAALRPILNVLTADEVTRFLTAYDRALDVAYPRRADGSCLFPFWRLFLTLIRSGEARPR